MKDTTENRIKVVELQRKSAQLRHWLIDLVNGVGASHIGGPLSACDVITALFYHFMNQEDEFILSKGHNGDLLFCVLADLGYYSFDELSAEFKKKHGRWGEHPNRLHNPGVVCSTGSLGHGLPIAAGMAMAAKINKQHKRIFCLVGDGELQEGSNWESIMCASKHCFDNLVLIVDKNRAQGTHMVSDLCDDSNLECRIADFGWDVRSIEDGNNMLQLFEALDALPHPDGTKKPVCLVLHTVKGKGVSFMEKDPANWHAGGFKDGKLEEAHQSVDLWLNEAIATNLTGGI